MSQLTILLCVVALIAIGIGQPLAHVHTYLIDTGRGNIIKPEFENASENIFFAKHSDAMSLDDEQNLGKSSATLDRAFLQPGKSMGTDKAGLGFDKRSIATGRAGFRPGKRSTKKEKLSDESKLKLLERILAESVAEQKNLRPFLPRTPFSTKKK